MTPAIESRAYDELVDFIAGGTTPEAVARFEPSVATKGRVAELVEPRERGRPHVRRGSRTRPLPDARAPHAAGKGQGLSSDKPMSPAVPADVRRLVADRAARAVSTAGFPNRSPISAVRSITSSPSSTVARRRLTISATPASSVTVSRVPTSAQSILILAYSFVSSIRDATAGTSISNRSELESSRVRRLARQLPESCVSMTPIEFSNGVLSKADGYAPVPARLSQASFKSDRMLARTLFGSASVSACSGTTAVF